jgi:hypothetical protein
MGAGRYRSWSEKPNVNARQRTPASMKANTSGVVSRVTRRSRIFARDTDTAAWATTYAVESFEACMMKSLSIGVCPAVRVDV